MIVLGLLWQIYRMVIVVQLIMITYDFDYVGQWDNVGYYCDN